MNERQVRPPVDRAEVDAGLRKLVARVLWQIQEEPKGDAEARKADFNEKRKDYMGAATRLLVRLEKAGVSVQLRPGANPDADDA